jgi:hypothetical protein
MESARRWWTLLGIFVAVAVVALLIQGLTVHKIGFGPLSIEFDSPKQDQPRGGTVPGGGFTVPTDNPFGGQADFAGAKSTTGTWRKQQGKLTLAVTQVENKDGNIRLHAKVTNGSTGQMSLPLFKNFVSTDDTGTTYEAVVSGLSSGWHDTVPASGSVTGTVDLSGKVADPVRSLTVSFSTVYGQFAPQQGITVTGIPVPR